MSTSLENRNRRNLILFILSYVINNLISGILYDTYVNYLQEVSVSIATSFWAFYGYATFIAAALLLLIPKIGYKKLVIFSGIVTSLAFFCILLFESDGIFYVTTLLALVGVQLHYIILAPFVAAYAGKAENGGIGWYTKTYYFGYIGYFLTTYLGGVFTVKMFSVRAGETYAAAKELSSRIADLGGTLKAAYIQGNEDVLLVSGIVGILALIPAFMIKEEKSDYSDTSKERVSLKEKASEICRILLSKSAVTYLIYWSLISFAMGLFTSYYTVYLNRNLHIDKATSSLLVSISYLSIVIFMILSPYVVKRLGKVVTIFLTVYLSVPFMLIIASGDSFGSLMIPVVGTALFMRAGLANLCTPAESALTMAIVPKSLRPAFTSLINFLAGIISIISGNFTGQILFTSQEGYRTAYYIAAALYALAAVIMLLGLKKYNRTEGE